MLYRTKSLRFVTKISECRFNTLFGRDDQKCLLSAFYILYHLGLNISRLKAESVDLAVRVTVFPIIDRAEVLGKDLCSSVSKLVRQSKGYVCSNARHNNHSWSLFSLLEFCGKLVKHCTDLVWVCVNHFLQLVTTQIRKYLLTWFTIKDTSIQDDKAYVKVRYLFHDFIIKSHVMVLRKVSDYYFFLHTKLF